MHKAVSKGLIGRIGVWAMVAVMLISLMPLTASATQSFKDTAAITPIVGGETSVSTITEFSKAAADPNVTKINLTENLVFADFQKYSRKTAGDLVIDGDGTYSIRVTKSDWWQCPVDPTGHVSMEFSDGYKSVTFLNIGLSGEAHNGFVYSKETTNLIFDGVQFDGPGLAITKNCLAKYASAVIIKDSNLTLRKRVPDSKDTLKGSYLFPAEAVEMGYGSVILTGMVTITKEEPPKSDYDHDELFYFKEKSGSLVVDENAFVNITSSSKATGSLYWAGLSYIACCTNDVNFLIGDNATFNLNVEGGIITEYHGFNKFTVGEGANVKMLVSTLHKPKVKSYKLSLDTGSYFRAKDITINPNAKVDIIAVNSALCDRDSVVGVDHLVVKENATFRVLAPANVLSEVSLKLHGSSPSIYLDKPNEVLVYNGVKPCSLKSPSSAIETAKSSDGNSGSPAATADAAFTFIGGGISTWCAKDNMIGLDYDYLKDEWTVDPTKATTWTTGFRAKTFTLKGCITKKDSSFVKTSLIDPDNNLGLDVNPANNPASSTTGIKSFCDKSVVQFNGASAKKFAKAYIYEKIITSDFKGWEHSEDLPLIELEGDGVEPISYEFEIDQYEDPAVLGLGGRFVFNEYDENYNPPSSYPVLESPGTRENLDPSVTLDIDGTTATLTIYPVDGEYPQVTLYYALHQNLGPAVLADLIIKGLPIPPGFRDDGPDYWYYSEG